MGQRMSLEQRTKTRKHALPAAVAYKQARDAHQGRKWTGLEAKKARVEAIVEKLKGKVSPKREKRLRQELVQLQREVDVTSL